MITISYCMNILRICVIVECNSFLAVENTGADINCELLQKKSEKSEIEDKISTERCRVVHEYKLQRWNRVLT